MSEYKLANGYVLTDEEIEARAKQWEDGSSEDGFVAIRIDDSEPSQRGNEPGLASQHALSNAAHFKPADGNPGIVATLSQQSSTSFSASRI